MIWAHRIMKSEEGYSVAEVFYEDRKPAYFCDVDLNDFDSVAELRQNIEWLQEALEQPILNYPEDFTGASHE